MKKIAVLTSGGDAPGMNAVIRAVARAGIFSEMEVYGILHGYEGLIDNEIFQLKWSDLGNIMHTGGTMLGSARSERFFEDKWIDKAADNLLKLGINSLVVIGGDGTFRGSTQLSKRGISIVCVPATIDNDLGYTDYTIGFDTAVNTVLSIISHIRDTSSAHSRTTIVEVMGRDCGDLALFSGLGGGADLLLVPEIPVDIQQIIERVREGQVSGKLHNIIVKSEGVDIPTDELEELIEGVTGQETRSVVLSYIQRGGSPSGRDRTLASLMGAKAVKLLEGNEKIISVAIGIRREDIISMSLETAIETKPVFDKDLYELALVLS